MLSRGYKRESSGYVLADETSTSVDIGDEACQIKCKFPRVIVAVDANRRRGMRHLLAMPEDVRPQVVLLDDGFQHRYVQPSFSILITDYGRLFYEDKLLPVGRLREPAKSASRANMVVISKCPENMDSVQCGEISDCVNHRFAVEYIHFTQILYQQPEHVFPLECPPCKPENIRKEDDILLVTGIANPAPLVAEIKKYSDNVRVITFADHHAFKKNDIQKMQTELAAMKNDKPLIFCTEKDAARIRHNPYFPDEWKSRMYYIPIQTHVWRDTNKLKDTLIAHISSMNKSSNVLQQSICNEQK